MIIPNQQSETHLIKNINRFTIVDFQIQLSYENWENIFSEKDVNSSFNNFLNTYLRLFNSSFSFKKSKKENKSQTNQQYMDDHRNKDFI